MKRNSRTAIVILVMISCGLLGWLATLEIAHSVEPVKPKEAVPASVWKVVDSTPKATKREERATFKDGTTVEMMASSRENETILRFPTDETYTAFLNVLEGSRIRLIGRLDRLHAMRLGFDDIADLDTLLNGENISIYPSITRMPDRSAPGTGIQEGAVGFNEKVISWLGITGDRSAWGKGVRVAVLDTGVVAHESLPGLVKSIAIEPFPAAAEETNGHGTAVASLIAGTSSIAPGVAPAVEVISVRVCGELGVADSFSIAAGILAAMDEGVQIINLSMGSHEDSPLMAEAVWMVQNHGIVVVAASGNDGQEDAAYPAAYPGVISVGAVDARGEQLDFSNFGEYLSMTAPGYQVNAAWPGNRYIRMSGTSASAPLVSGAIAATMSQGNGIIMTAAEAAAVVMNFTDEAGIPGPDSQYGSGILDLARIMFRNTPGLLDAAVTNQRVVSTGNGSQELRVTIQNRGTQVLINTTVEIITTAGSTKANATSIAPGDLQTFTLPLSASFLAENIPLQVTTRLTLGTPGQDQTPQNNLRTETFSLR